MVPAEATTAVGESQDMSDRHPAGSAEELWKTARPWGLGQIRYPTSRLQTWSGTTIRHPGTFMRLAMDDDGVWDCRALTTADDGSGLWKLERGSGLNASEADSVKDGETRELDLDAEGYVLKPYAVQKEDSQWKWVLASKQPNAFPLAGVLPEEPLTGYWERKLLALTAGNPDVWRWAEENPPLGLIYVLSVSVSGIWAEWADSLEITAIVTNTVDCLKAVSTAGLASKSGNLPLQVIAMGARVIAIPALCNLRAYVLPACLASGPSTMSIPPYYLGVSRMKTYLCCSDFALIPLTVHIDFDQRYWYRHHRDMVTFVRSPIRFAAFFSMAACDQNCAIPSFLAPLGQAFVAS
ncbi:peptidoglycan binding domain-containing protein [Colletotrichum acutatum]